MERCRKASMTFVIVWKEWLATLYGLEPPSFFMSRSTLSSISQSHSIRTVRSSHQINKQASVLDSARVPLLHLAAQIRRGSPWVVAKSIANGILRNKDQELVVGHVQTELTSDVIVILGGLVTGTAGTVEGRARVDARGGNVAAVLAREGIASPAGGCWIGQGDGGRGEDGSQGGELHFE